MQNRHRESCSSRWGGCTLLEQRRLIGDVEEHELAGERLEAPLEPEVRQVHVGEVPLLGPTGGVPMGRDNTFTCRRLQKLSAHVEMSDLSYQCLVGISL